MSFYSLYYTLQISVHFSNKQLVFYPTLNENKTQFAFVTRRVRRLKGACSVQSLYQGAQAYKTRTINKTSL